MKSKRTMRRLGLGVALLGLLVMAAAAPAAPAAPNAVGLQAVPQAAWAGHGCPMPVQVNLTGDSVNVGGYETKLTFDTTHFGYTGGNIALSDFLSDGGTRSTSGDDGTPLLEAAEATSVKFGDYSWGTTEGADGTGLLATVNLDIVACGNGIVSLSEGQVVDVLGNSLGAVADTGNVNARVNNRYDTNADGSVIVGPLDVLAVVGNQGFWSGGCSDGYQYDTNLDGSVIVGPLDVLAVVGNQGFVSCP